LESEEREAATGRSLNVVHILPQSILSGSSILHLSISTPWGYGDLVSAPMDSKQPSLHRTRSASGGSIHAEAQDLFQRAKSIR